MTNQMEESQNMKMLHTENAEKVHPLSHYIFTKTSV